MAAEPLPQTLSAARVGRDVDGWSASASSAAGARRADRQGRVVQSMAHKVTRPCSRNGCPAPARASMELDYAGKKVTLVPLMDRRDPRFLEVCPTHAEGMDVPRGWDLVDERDEEPMTPSGPPTAEEMGSSATVAVLAAALREVPAQADPADEDPIVDEVPLPSVVVAEPQPQPQPQPQPPSGRTVAPRHVEAVPDERQLRFDAAADPSDGAVTDTDSRAVARPVRAARDEAQSS